MANVLCVLYDDPVDGYPTPTPATRSRRSSATPTARPRRRRRRSTSRRASCWAASRASSACGRFLEARGHRLVVTSDKDGPDSEFERELPDADVVISQPFWPAYLTAERIAKAPNLKLAITAGIGSDHVDLQAAIDHGITVAEVTYCNSISVSEHVVMMILGLVRNYIPPTSRSIDGGWNIADCVSRSYDLEGMQVGTVAAGRIGSAVLRRLKPFEVGLHYTDRHRLPDDVEQGARRHLPPDGRVAGRGLRRGDDQRPLHPGDRAHVRRRADRQDEARRLPRQHRARQDLRPRRGRPRPGERASSRATPATSGSRSRPRAITPGGRCPTTA